MIGVSPCSWPSSAAPSACTRWKELTGWSSEIVTAAGDAGAAPIARARESASAFTTPRLAPAVRELGARADHERRGPGVVAEHEVALRLGKALVAPAALELVEQPTLDREAERVRDRVVVAVGVAVGEGIPGGVVLRRAEL